MTHFNAIGQTRPNNTHLIPTADQARVDVLATQISSMISRIDTSLTESDQSVRRQNENLMGPCARITALFNAIFRLMGLIR